MSYSRRPTRATLYRLAAGVPPIKLRTEGIPDNSNKITFFYGPVLLAGALGKEGIENLDPHAEERAKFDHIPSPPIPVLVAGNRTIQDYIKPTDEPATFIVPGSVLKTPGFDKTGDITLIPFHKMHYQRYIVYWDLFTEQQWKQAKERFDAEQAEIGALEARTIGHIVLVTYDIPAELTKGKTTVTVKLQAHPWRTAGGLFECRTVRAD